MLTAVWPLTRGLTANFIWTGECVFDQEGKRHRRESVTVHTTYRHMLYTHSYAELSEQQALNPFGIISKCAIAHLTFNSVQLGTVPLMALAPKYCSPNTEIDVLGST